MYLSTNKNNMKKTRSDKGVKRGKYKPRAFTDFQTKEKRLAKPKPYSKDFMLEDGDDCFGFSEKTENRIWNVCVVLVTIAVTLFAWHAISYIIANGLQL